MSEWTTLSVTPANPGVCIVSVGPLRDASAIPAVALLLQRNSLGATRMMLGFPLGGGELRTHDELKGLVSAPLLMDTSQSRRAFTADEVKEVELAVYRLLETHGELPTADLVHLTNTDPIRVTAALMAMEREGLVEQTISGWKRPR